MPARKRKLPDDEPLVPHGLIGQALDSAETNSADATPPEGSKVSPPPPTKSEDRDPRLPKPPQSASPAKPAKAPSGRLLHWPKIRQQLGGAHVRTALVRLRAFPKQISAHLASIQTKLNRAEGLSRIRDLAASETDQVRKELKSLRERAIPELQKVRDSAQLPAKVARLRQGISLGATKGRGMLQIWRANAMPRFQVMRRSVSTGTRKSVEICRAWWTNATPRVQAMRQRVSTGARKSLETSRLWRTNAAAHVQTLRDQRRLERRAIWTETAAKPPNDGWKLRIRLAGLPLKLRIAFARAKLEWQLGRKSVSRDSRLWSSIALAALAALLIMGLFSITRHFAQASLPSNRVSASSSQEATATATPATILPQPVAAHAKLLRKTSTPKVSAATRAAKGKKPAVKPTIHRNADSDYVAKDTYVYYGSRSSR